MRQLSELEMGYITGGRNPMMDNHFQEIMESDTLLPLLRTCFSNAIINIASYYQTRIFG